MKQVLYNVYDWNEFEDLVLQHFGQPYSFVVDMECGNDSEHKTYAALETEPVPGSNKAKLAEYEKQDIERFKTTGRGSYLYGRLVQDMVNRQLIPPGHYLVTVCW